MALAAGEEIRAGIVTDADGRQVISVDTVTVTGELTVANEVAVTNDSSKTYVGASALTVKNGFANTAASATDSEVVAAVNNKKIRVLALVTSATGTASSLTFNSASTAISATVKAGASLPYNPHGWFQTADSTLLNLELSGAVSVDGSLTYIEAE